MRDFKFRAWDKFNENMTFSKTLCDFFDDLQKLKDGGNAPLLMQSIGITSDKGIDIFEGDLVRNKWTCKKKDNGIPPYYVVVFERCSFCFANCCGKIMMSNKYRPAEFAKEGNWEIVGNIHENPELLQST